MEGYGAGHYATMAPILYWSEIVLVLSISSISVILSYQFSPSILLIHQLMNVCSVLVVIVLVVLHVSDPYNSMNWI